MDLLTMPLQGAGLAPLRMVVQVRDIGRTVQADPEPEPTSLALKLRPGLVVGDPFPVARSVLLSNAIGRALDTETGTPMPILNIDFAPDGLADSKNILNRKLNTPAPGNRNPAVH